MIQVSTETRLLHCLRVLILLKLLPTAFAVIGESKTKYIMCAPVTQGEDASRIWTVPLVQIWALARNAGTQSLS